LDPSNAFATRVATFFRWAVRKEFQSS